MKTLTLLILLCSLSGISIARENNEKPESTVINLTEWRYQEGNNPAWASSEFDDSDWRTVTINQPLNTSTIDYGKVFWLRTEIPSGQIDEDSIYALMINQFGASEIYVNGRLVKQFGKINQGESPELYNPHNYPLPVIFRIDQANHIAIRFAPDIPTSQWVINRTEVPVLQVRIQPLEHALKGWESKLKQSRFSVGTGVVSSVFALLFLMLYVFFPKQILYLFYGLFNLFLTIINFLNNFQDFVQYDLVMRAFLISGNVLVSRLIGMSVLLFLLHSLNRMRPLFWWYIAFMLLVDFPLTLVMPVQYMVISNVLRGIILIICLWLAYHAFRSNKKEDVLVGILACTVAMVNSRFLMEFFLGLEPSLVFIVLPPVITTLTIIIYLALRNAKMHKDLERQLVQVKELSEENLRQEQEKQQILTTQKEELERQVKERTASLNQQKKELQNTLDELKSTQAQLIQSEKMASLGELTAGIAHEIQNPLNFVNNFSEVNKELLLEMEEAIQQGDFENAKALAKDIAENQIRINHHGKRADAIVKSMLQHSRSSSGKKELTDINALCDEYLRLAFHGLRAKDKSFNAKFETNLDLTLPKINVVPQDIGRVVLNLINNAFYAVNERLGQSQPDKGYEPTVTVSTKNLGDKIEISVKDNGNGIPDSIKKKIFLPFFTSKPTGQGTGLGLSLSYDIVKTHSGELKVKSVEGEGSEFIVQLPFANARLI